MQQDVANLKQASLYAITAGGTFYVRTLARTQIATLQDPSRIDHKTHGHDFFILLYDGDIIITTDSLTFSIPILLYLMMGQNNTLPIYESKRWKL